MKPLILQYEQYTMKAAGTRALAYLTQAKAGAGPIAESTGKTAQQANENLALQLRTRNQSRKYDEEFQIYVPHPEDYGIALFSVSPSDPVVAMMQALVTAGPTGITATQLANVAGYQGYEAANLHLGQTAAKIADVVGSPRPKSRLHNESTVATCMIATYDGDTRDAQEHLLWFVRPNFALAWHNLKQGN